jgi:hypothetical protein
MEMAREASTAEARLIHYDLAGRYSIKAAQFPLPGALLSQRAASGERPVLRLRRPKRAPLHLPREGEGS